MPIKAATITHLFTDIEGSTRLWEREPERMGAAVARHDTTARALVAAQGGTVVKMLGDGVHAVFEQPLDALAAALQMQLALAAPAADGIELRVRCGLHLGTDERRDNDFFGTTVNRAARIAGAAHGGQVLVSRAVADALAQRLPAELSLRDLGAVRLRDLSGPQPLFQLVHPQLRAEFPALRSLEAVPNNLPQQLDSFVDRVRELADARRLLAANRLLTLLGMGGIGKSRLSVQLGAEVLDDYPDGVWLVELAGLVDPALVAQAVASVLGVREEAGRPVIDALTTFVRERKLLILLDNCEHLIAACAELARRLLQSALHLKLLVSSREPLQLAGETCHAVPPLSAPALDSAPSPDALVRHDAVQLFVDRATAAQPAFRLDAGNAAAVAEICHRLDGIALAIELAAARTRALSVVAICARLNDRFRLLVSGDRTALPRQRTLRALIDWSHDLLDDAERALLRRLAVFAGGWTLEAAEAVCSGAGIEPNEALDLLTSLVEKSLVVMDVGGGRYRMLDTVRHYAADRLSESGDAAVAQTRHLDFHLALAEQARAQLDGPEQGAWLARLDVERENLLAAQRWASRAEAGAEPGLRLVDALRRYWIKRGLLSLGQRLCIEVLAHPGLQARDDARCRALFAAGQLCSFMGRYDEARGHLAESLAIARATGNRKWVAGVLQTLGMACLGAGDLAAARGHFEDALRLARVIGDRRELAAALNALAQLHRMENRPDAAEPLYADAVALARQLGDRESIAIGLLNLAMVLLGRAAGEPARALLVEALDIAAEIGSVPAGQSALEVCAGLAAVHADWVQAARFYGAAQAQMARSGLQRDPADEAFLAPLVDGARNALGAQPFADAEGQGSAASFEAALARARSWLDEPSAGPNEGLAPAGSARRAKGAGERS